MSLAPRDVCKRLAQKAVALPHLIGIIAPNVHADSLREPNHHFMSKKEITMEFEITAVDVNDIDVPETQIDSEETNPSIPCCCCCASAVVD